MNNYSRFQKEYSLIILFVFFLPVLTLANSISGRISDHNGGALANVNILLQDSEYGTTTDSSGHFVLNDIPERDYLLQISLMGYTTEYQQIRLPSDAVLNIVLHPTVIRLSEVTVSGTMVSDINSPVTFSTLNIKEIADKHSVQDIPSLLQVEPGVYVTNDGGSGFGDSQIMIRGFDEKRLQVLVNNIPVNDPETKEIPWSSWSALPEAAQAIQVMRGVGTSLYGTGAIGGVINIVTLDASSNRGTKFKATMGQFGVKKFGLSHDTGIMQGSRSFLINLGYLEGSGWRDNSYFRGFQYYLAFTQRLGLKHLIKLIFHGSPQYHTLAKASLSVASYAEPDQFAHDSLRLNSWGLPAYGFGASFNGNIHVASSDLGPNVRGTSLADAVFMRSKIGASSINQVGGLILANDRGSLNNNISHRPQFEAHHRWFLSDNFKLTTTAFITKGLDYSDDVYPAWYIPRGSDGYYDYEVMTSRNYWGGSEVFEYRYYSDFLQTGILSSLSTRFGNHEFSLGIEARRWVARHAGEVLNNFDLDSIGVPIGSVVHSLAEGDLFYDFTTTKPQGTLFGHAKWLFGKLQVMTNFQYSAMKFRVIEQVPSNNNYPTYLDPDAIDTHGGGLWVGTATIDHDSTANTPEVPVAYALWDYSKSFQYITPRLGLSYTFTPAFNVYSSYSIGVKEPEIKHFYGYGAPQDDLELEKTEDFEAGLSYNSSSGRVPFTVNLAYYNIDFAGKLMQITIPEKANTPGYDYAGHTYVPVGDARYTGLEFSGRIKFPRGFNYQTSLSKSSNTWGEPQGTAGAQKLYANVAVAGEDYEDVDGDGVWGEGGTEIALHRDFVSKYGARYDVGMPQFIWNNILEYHYRQFTAGITTRYFQKLYVLENNSEILVGTGADDLFFTSDDEFSATLPPALITDLRASWKQTVNTSTYTIKLQVNNLFDEKFWQRGDEYGVIPGTVRTWILGVELLI